METKLVYNRILSVKNSWLHRKVYNTITADVECLVRWEPVKSDIFPVACDFVLTGSTLFLNLNIYAVLHYTGILFPILCSFINFYWVANISIVKTIIVACVVKAKMDVLLNALIAH